MGGRDQHVGWFFEPHFQYVIDIPRALWVLPEYHAMRTFQLYTDQTAANDTDVQIITEALGRIAARVEAETNAGLQPPTE